MTSDPTRGDDSSSTETVVIRIFANHELAELAVAKLEANGISSWTKSDDAGGMYPNLTLAQGVRLMVERKDLAAAVAVLDEEISESEREQLERDAVAAVPGEEKRSSLAWLQIIAGVIVGVAACLLYQEAENHGTKTHYHHTNGRLDEEWVYIDGRLSEYRQDRNLDGEWDHWSHYERGQLVRAEYDNNFDGKPDEWWTYSDAGTDTLQKDRDFNGVPDEFCAYQNRIIQQLDMKPNGSTFATIHEIYQHGILTEEWRGGDSTGNFKEIVKYDPFFNPIATNPFQLPSPKALEIISNNLHRTLR